jgi:hypothetical protein
MGEEMSLFSGLGIVLAFYIWAFIIVRKMDKEEE